MVNIDRRWVWRWLPDVPGEVCNLGQAWLHGGDAQPFDPRSISRRNVNPTFNNPSQTDLTDIGFLKMHYQKLMANNQQTDPRWIMNFESFADDLLDLIPIVKSGSVLARINPHRPFGPGNVKFKLELPIFDGLDATIPEALFP